MICINRNSQEYQNLKQVSGIPTNILDIQCSHFLEEHGRFPQLDELPGSKSSEYIISKLGKVTDLSKLLEFTGTKSVEEAVININTRFTDQQFKAFKIDNKVFIESKQKPTSTYKNLEQIHTPDNSISPITIIEGLDKLRDMYGYDFKYVSNDELAQPEWNDLMPSDKIVNGFIYDNNIYINVDRNTPQSKIHEMLHLLVGGIRFKNSELYTNLIQSTLNINLEILSEKYPYKTQNDALEELFVSELSKYLTGNKSMLNNLSKEDLYEINRFVQDTLDILLEGDYSAKSIPSSRLYSLSLSQVAKDLNSSKLTSNFKGFNIANVHRKLSNIKESLLRNNELIEKCE